MKLAARGVTIDWPRRPLIMGIVNLVADSFSGDGIVEIDRAIEHARRLVRDGANIIDIGAESARTNRGAMAEDEEAGQLVRFIEQWREEVRSSKLEVRNKRQSECGEMEKKEENAPASVSNISNISSDSFGFRIS
ncbi:MAG TPA: dihydropteroate synthase, partial [Chthoniobacteraceae bacterium]|nr:dihydropteroate synthase [Chthoniobacteraceae bacterium]